MTTTNQTINADTIKQVYSGKANTCCCGCAGKHSTDAASIKRLVNKINKAIMAREAVDFGGSYVAFETGTRLHVAYFADKAPAKVEAAIEPMPFFCPPFAIN